MKIWILSKDPIFITDIAWGFEQIGWETKIAMVDDIIEFEKIQNEYQADIIMTLGSPAHYKNLKVLGEIKQSLDPKQVKMIHWDTDGISWAAKYELPLIESIEPDITFTICPDMKKLLESKGIKVERLSYGVNLSNHYNVQREEEYSKMITYIGNSYHTILKNPNHYRTKSVMLLIASLLKNGERVDMWGDRGLTTFYNNWSTNVGIEAYHGSCQYTNTRRIYSSALINLVPQNHPYHLTKRTYEIMGCKGFVITYDTPEVRRQFEVGKDLIAVGNEKELFEAINYFKERTVEHDQIRHNGFKAIQKHTYKQRAEEILQGIHDYENGTLK